MRFRDFTISRLGGFEISRFYMFTISRFRGFTTSRFFDFLDLRFHDFAILRFYELTNLQMKDFLRFRDFAMYWFRDCAILRFNEITVLIRSRMSALDRPTMCQSFQVYFVGLGSPVQLPRRTSGNNLPVALFHVVSVMVLLCVMRGGVRARRVDAPPPSAGGSPSQAEGVRFLGCVRASHFRSITSDVTCSLHVCLVMCVMLEILQVV